ncbi:MAG: NYN domain-containing protein [Sphingomonadaceae bacterium]
MSELQQGDVALYIDWENIKYSLLNKENRLPNAIAIKDAAAKYGRVVAAKAYANWQEGQHLRDPNDLYSAGIEPIYVPTVILGFGDSSDGAPRRKNSIDVKLAVDCVDASLSNPNISTFVLVTGDGDFVHLINTLRLRGKRVVVIGTSWSTSWQLTSSADHFLAYDVTVDPVSPSPSARNGSTATLDDALKALVDVVKFVREKGRPNVFAQVKLLLTSRLGNFDEQVYGFAKFKDFMKEAERRGLIKTTTVGLIDRAYLPWENVEDAVAGDASDGAEARMHMENAQVPSAAFPASNHRGSNEDAMMNLARFVNKLEESSPFMSFNYIVSRAFESRTLQLSTSEISSLLDEAIQSGVFLTDSRTILDRATGEYRDINIFRLNREHPTVAAALAPSQSEGKRQG